MSTHAYSLIIDTTLYSGNFERPLCAWLTGQVGECGVGGDVAEKARAALRHAQWWEDHVVQTDNEGKGCPRPVAIAPTPGFFNDGVGGHHPDTPEGREAALPCYRARRQVDFERESRLYDQVVIGEGGWTQAGLDATLDRLAQRREEDLNRPEVQAYPAYQSVEIFLDEAPTEAVLDEVRERLQAVVEDPYGTGVFRSYDGMNTPPGFEVIGLRESHTQTAAPVVKVRSLKR